jgi:hypothetical protein
MSWGFLVIDAAGNIGAKFSGELDAIGGIAIPISTVAVPPNSRRIRWYDPATGKVLAQDYVASQTRFVESNPDGTNDDGGFVQLAALGGIKNVRLMLLSQLTGGDAAQLIKVIVGGDVRTLLDGTGKSDFVQGLAEQGLKVIRGRFNGATAPPTTLNGAGFTLVKNAVGNYTINFTQAFSSAPAVTLSSNTDETFIGSAVSGAAANVFCAGPAGALLDGTMNFIAIGPI